MCISNGNVMHMPADLGDNPTYEDYLEEARLTVLFSMQEGESDESIFKLLVTKEDILKWKIGFCKDGEYAGRVIIPSFNVSGYANYYVARSYGFEWPKYKNPPASRDIIFNELYVNWDEDIVIVEGVFDAIKAGNAIPLLGSTLRENSALFQAIVKNGRRVFLALDEDASKKARSIARLLLKYGVEVYEIDTSGVEDVGEMTKEEFRTRKNNAAIVEKDNYLLQRLFAV